MELYDAVNKLIREVERLSEEVRELKKIVREHVTEHPGF